MTLPLPRLEGVARDHYFFRHPEHWTTWPVLPVVRRKADGEDDLGVLYDFAHTSGRTGFSCTVFLCNICSSCPRRRRNRSALPREVFDTWDEVSAAGWTVD